ncbi:nucleolar RNA-binding Nop10p family protein [Candidatus Woesearchaeota archaeon]|nr:nucleolar RNA-binding Nop10p family protein [Candidatus Woesearchaeota archaeon]
MTKEILKCFNCNVYTLKDLCPKCSNKTTSPKPAKFSLEDKTGVWRREYKRRYPK